MKTAHQILPAALFVILSIFCLTPTLTRAGQSQLETIITDASGEATASNSPLQNATTEANTPYTTTANVTVGVTNTTATLTATSGSVIENGTASNNNGTEQHSVTIHVVQGQGEICLSSQVQMPLCTSTSQTVPVNAGGLVNFDSTADNGFVWDHYDGLGIGQGQDFNAVITRDTATGVYFTPMSTANATAAISLPTDSITTISSSGDSTTTIPIANITTPVPSNVTVTVTQYVNQTVSVTQTVGTDTISYTVTSTVAISTITQKNATLAVYSTTTVSTTTGP